MPKKKRRRTRRRATSGKLMQRAKVGGWTALYAYLKEQKATFRNVPKIDAIGQDATMMIAAHLLARHGPRVVKGPCDNLATGLAGVVGYRLGQSGFKLDSLQGDPDEDLVGELDPADFIDEAA